MLRKLSILVASMSVLSCAPAAQRGTVIISQDDYEERCVAGTHVREPSPALQAAASVSERPSNVLGYQVTPEQHAAAEHERAVVALAGILLARRSTTLVASTELCVLEVQLSAARAALAREQQVARVSGVLDEDAAHEAGTHIVDLGERISDVRRVMQQSRGGAPASCTGGVREAASCRINPRICASSPLHERAWDAATVVLSGDADVSAYLEARARERLSEEWAVEAETRAATIAADLAR